MNATDSYFTPHALAIGARERGCLTCEFFQGEFCGGHVVSKRFERVHVGRQCAETGCIRWALLTGEESEMNQPRFCPAA